MRSGRWRPGRSGAHSRPGHGAQRQQRAAHAGAAAQRRHAARAQRAPAQHGRRGQAGRGHDAAAGGCHYGLSGWVAAGARRRRRACCCRWRCCDRGARPGGRATEVYITEWRTAAAPAWNTASCHRQRTALTPEFDKSSGHSAARVALQEGKARTLIVVLIVAGRDGAGKPRPTARSDNGRHGCPTRAGGV